MIIYINGIRCITLAQIEWASKQRNKSLKKLK